MEPFLYLVDFILKLYAIWERFSKRYLRHGRRGGESEASRILYAEILSCDITAEVRDFYQSDSTISCSSLGDYLDWCDRAELGESPITIVFRLNREIRVSVVNLETSHESTTDSRVLFSNLELDSLLGSSLSLFNLENHSPAGASPAAEPIGGTRRNEASLAECAGQRAETFLDTELSRTRALLRRLKSQ